MSGSPISLLCRMFEASMSQMTSPSKSAHARQGDADRLHLRKALSAGAALIRPLSRSANSCVFSMDVSGSPFPSILAQNPEAAERTRCSYLSLRQQPVKTIRIQKQAAISHILGPSELSQLLRIANDKFCNSNPVPETLPALEWNMAELLACPSPVLGSQLLRVTLDALP